MLSLICESSGRKRISLPLSNLLFIFVVPEHWPGLPRLLISHFVEGSLTWAYWQTIIIFEGQHKTHHVFHGRYWLDLLGVAGQMPVWRYGNMNPGVEPSWVFVVSGAQLIDTLLSQWHLIFSAGTIWCWMGPPSTKFGYCWLMMTIWTCWKIRLWH